MIWIFNEIDINRIEDNDYAFSEFYPDGTSKLFLEDGSEWYYVRCLDNEVENAYIEAISARQALSKSPESS